MTVGITRNRDPLAALVADDAALMMQPPFVGMAGVCVGCLRGGENVAECPPGSGRLDHRRVDLLGGRHPRGEVRVGRPKLGEARDGHVQAPALRNDQPA